MFYEMGISIYAPGNASSTALRIVFVFCLIRGHDVDSRTKIAIGLDSIGNKTKVF